MEACLSLQERSRTKVFISEDGYLLSWRDPWKEMSNEKLGGGSECNGSNWTCRHSEFCDDSPNCDGLTFARQSEVYDRLH